jgi:hypothetical protein
VQASVKTKGTFFKCPHLLKAKGHGVHGDLNQETIFGVFLKLKPVKQSLGFLKQA